MSKFYSLLSLGCVLALSQSCRTAYTPNALNVPLLQEQGEVKLTLSPTNYQAAYAVTDNIGIMANGRYAGGSVSTSSNGTTTDSYDTKNVVAEAGVGYFGHTARSFTYELYAGGGITQFGYRGTGGSSTNKNYDLSGGKFFVQPSIGFVSRGFDIALSTRLSGLQFGEPTTNYSVAEMKSYDLYGLGKNLHLFLEPALTLRGGYKFVKLQAQVGGSFKLTEAVIPYNGLILNLGLALDFGQWYRD